jgi:DNA-binding transcriptional LysR family regulator
MQIHLFHPFISTLHELHTAAVAGLSGGGGAWQFQPGSGCRGLTQPAVSRGVAELEEALGVRLLDRTTREVVLTEAGTALVPALERLLGQLDDTLEETRQSGNAIAAGCDSQCADDLGATDADVCGGLREPVSRHPVVRARQRPGRRPEQIRAGAVDLAC